MQEFAEDLSQLAEFEFRTALKSCSGCTDYHALFGYGRLAGHKNGMNTDVDTLTPLLSRYAGPGARILIAGSGDSGLLALTARATLGREPEITVADRCPTPLAVCQTYAGSHGLNIHTAQADLAAARVPNRYDLILSHGILLYIPRERHPAFFRNLAQSLGPNGTILLVSWNASRPERDAASFAKRRTDMTEALKAKGISLPEDEPAFRQRIARHDEDYGKRFRIRLEAEEVEASIAAAGLRVRERLEHDKRVRPQVANNLSPPAKTYFFIVSRA